MTRTPKATTTEPAQCRFCGRQWAPPRGVSASTSYCAACSRERWEATRKRFEDDGKETVVVGKYLVRRKKP